MSTYIIIEISENDNPSDILNALFTKTTNARITVTKNIGEYAFEREKLKTVSTKEVVQKSPQKPETFESPPMKKPCLEPPKPSITPSTASESKKSENLKIRIPFPKFPIQTPKQESQISHISILKDPKIEEPEISFEEIIQSSSLNHPPPSKSINNYQPSISEMIRNSNMTPERHANGKSKRVNQAFPCQMCGANIKAYHFDYYKRSNHAIIHTQLQRYMCPVSNCGSKTRHRSNMVVHARTTHGIKGKVDVIYCLSQEEDDELKRTVVECFPEMEETVRNMKKRENKRDEEDGNGAESDEEFMGEEPPFSF